MLENGQRIKQTDTVSKDRAMGLYMKDFGETINNMEKEKRNVAYDILYKGLTCLVTKEIILKEKNKVKENMFGLMAVIFRAIGLRIR